MQAARLEVETLKWYTSKIAPKLYGDRVTHEHEAGGTVRVMFESALPLAGTLAALASGLASPATDPPIDAEFTHVDSDTVAMLSP